MARIFCVCFATIAFIVPAHAGEPKKPNIIYILADDLGYAELGCYGQKKIKTPSLDKMAAQGLRFTQHYAGNAVCAPSRCVLMTGLHSGHAQVRNNIETKPAGQQPLAAGTITIQLSSGATPRRCRSKAIPHPLPLSLEERGNRGPAGSTRTISSRRRR